MIIDATKHFHPDHRPYTCKAAVAAVLAQIEVGGVLQVSEFLDPSGRALALGRLQTLVGTCKGAATYQTRKAPAPTLATIRRIA